MHKNKHKIRSEFVLYFLVDVTRTHSHKHKRIAISSNGQNERDDKKRLTKNISLPLERKMFSSFFFFLVSAFFFLLLFKRLTDFVFLFWCRCGRATRPYIYLFHVDARAVFRLFYHHFSEHINFLIKLLFGYLVN